MLASFAALLILGHPVSIKDELQLSFAFFGCNRIDQADWEATAAENPSSANIPQLRQTYADLASLSPIPKIVFGGGDLIMGYAGDNGEVLAKQLAAWPKLFFESPLPGKTTMVPFPGNHELNKKVGAVKSPNPVTVKVWKDWYAQSGFKQMAHNGPKQNSGDPDAVVGDQSFLNYSFDRKGVHFVVLNTDTLTSFGKDLVGWIPGHWAARDIEKAQKNPKVKAIFVTGHRNLITPNSSKGDAPIDPACGEVLLNAIRMNSKVRAFVCAHVHAWDLKELGGPSRAWQVVAGNGGSSLEKDWKPEGGTYFGFVVIEVFKSGKVVLQNFRRPTPAEPQKYFEAGPTLPAKALPVETVLYDPVK